MMNPRVRRTVGLVALLGLVPLTGMTGGTTANATSAAKPTVACKRMSLKVTGRVANGTLGGCSVAATGGSGKMNNFNSLGGTVAWANGTTTTYTSTPTTVGVGVCPTGDHGSVINGSVATSTNAAVPVGAPVMMTVCVNATVTKAISAVGTKVTF